MANSFLNYYAGSMAPPVKGPGGTLQAVPNYLTPEQIYAGILPTLPPPSLPLNPPMPPRPSNSWPGGSDPTGAGPGSFAQMQGFVGDPAYGGGNQNSGAIRTAGQAGNTALPPGITPSSVLRAFEQINSASGKVNQQQPQTALAAIQKAAPPPSAPWGSGIGYGYSSGKDESQLGANAGLPSIYEPTAPIPPAKTSLLDFLMPRQRPAFPVAAMPPMPRPRPLLPGRAPVDVTVRGGNAIPQPMPSRSGSSSQYVPPKVVKLSSGNSAAVGTTGTAQGGKYVYAVQSDGSVKNLTTGRITAPPKR